MTREEFLERLLGMQEAYELGIAEAKDMRDPDAVLTRSDAARYAHLYMRENLGLPDIPDISEAEILKDLYDCRVCANHIAQAYLRGIMPGKDMPGVLGRVFLAFDPGAPVEEAEAEQIILKIYGIRNLCR